MSASNSASLSLIGPDGRIHTLLEDSRFPRCAGRDLDDEEEEEEEEEEQEEEEVVQAQIQIQTQSQRSTSAHTVPFLEETVVRSVAAGGLYTAAVSAEGELFLWGQAGSGAEGEIAVLKNSERNGDGDGGDEYVKIAEVGDGARVAHVGVGFGHVMVALEGGGGGDAGGDEGERKRVFVVGDDSWGALGLGYAEEEKGFVEEFTEVSAWVEDSP